MKRLLLTLTLGVSMLLVGLVVIPSYGQEANRIFQSFELHGVGSRLLLGAGATGGIQFDGPTVDANTTKLTVVDPTAANVITFGNATGPVPTVYSCGASLAAAGACANTATGTFHMITGSALLSGSTSTITGISPAFASATSWWCVANDITTRANPVQAIPASVSTLTITNTTGATDLIQFMCAGN